MFQPGMKSSCTLLFILSLFTYSCSFAENRVNSSFEIRLFNNIKEHRLLHYIISSDGQAFTRGNLFFGDENGQLIKINGKSKVRANAEIVVTDLAGKIIWDNRVSYWGASPSFYTNTVSIDSHYNVGTSAYPSIHAIGFDIRS